MGVEPWLAFPVVRVVLVVLVLSLVACGGDSGQSATCEAWEAHNEAVLAGELSPGEVVAGLDRVTALAAAEGGAEWSLLAATMRDAVHPFDGDAYEEAALGFNVACQR